MASPRVNALRTAAALVALAGCAWIGYQTMRAGDDIPPPASQAVTHLSGGSASDKRLDGKSWSLDYDSATMSQDGSYAEIEHIRDGIITRDGKPFMHVQAQHVSANLAANDFTVSGPVTFTEIGGEQRTLVTSGGHYAGATHTLDLPNRTTIRSGALHLIVSHASINFLTGSTDLGRIVGTM